MVYIDGVDIRFDKLYGVIDRYFGSDYFVWGVNV